MAKKINEHVRDREQLQTYMVTTRKIMWSKEFNYGVQDASSGLPYRREYERWDANKQWNYERGRLFGAGTKGQVEVKRGKEVRNDALYQYQLLRSERVIPS